MAKRIITRTRYIPKSPMERSQTFSLVGKIKKISEHGIQITKGDGKGRFWVDTDFFVERNEISITDIFLEDQDVKLSLIFNCYSNKNEEFTVKPHLADIQPIESLDDFGSDLKNPNFHALINVSKVTKTQYPGLFILTGTRINSLGFAFERYNFRYYTKDMVEPEIGDYEITFNLHQSSKIITTNGDIFHDEEEYNVNIDGVTTKKRTNLYYPALEILKIEPFISAREEEY